MSESRPQLREIRKDHHPLCHFSARIETISLRIA
jgi:hypothetical protein